MKTFRLQTLHRVIGSGTTTILGPGIPGNCRYALKNAPVLCLGCDQLPIGVIRPSLNELNLSRSADSKKNSNTLDEQKNGHTQK